MTAGFNLVCNIWRFTTNDDAVGGALPSGTVIYPNAELRMSSMKPTQALLEQGLETPHLYMACISPTYIPTGTFELFANYQVEIINPPISEHYHKFFVIIGPRPASMSDPRKYWMATLRRLETANSNLLQ